MSLVNRLTLRSREPRRFKDDSQRRQRITYGAVGIVGVLLGWSAVTHFGLVNAFLLPSPGAALATGLELARSGTLWGDTIASLTRVLIGFVVALSTAVPLGILMGLLRRVNYLVDPLIELIRPVPPIAIIPLAMLWFGIGEESKIFLIAFGSFFPILLNTLAGLRAIDPTHVRAIKTLGASRWQVIRRVVIPAAFPQIVVGARLGIAMGFIVLVAAELIAADSGLGYLIEDARRRFATDAVLVGIVVIGVIGLALNQLMLLLERRVVPWRFLESDS